MGCKLRKWNDICFKFRVFYLYLIKIYLINSVDSGPFMKNSRNYNEKGYVVKSIYILIIPVLTLFFSGCTAKTTESTIDMKPPKYVQQMPAKEQRDNFSNQGSLFGQGKNPLFADRKAMSNHDIVTVVIEESANTSSSAQRNVNRNSNSNLGGGLTTYDGDARGLRNVTRELNNLGNIGFESSSQSDFQGGGTNTRSEQFSTTVSARIIKVMSNGNYFIEGSREILIDGEKQIIQLSGVIRPYDIDQYNQINSRYISDARIVYTTQGELNRATKRGWGTSIFESIWPF